MTPQEIIRKLWDLGHFHGTGIEKIDLETLSLTDKSVRLAMLSFQETMLGEKITEDANNPDFQSLIGTDRCGFPDYPVGPLLASDQPLEANWPNSCRGNLKYGRTFSTLKGLSKQQVSEMLIAAMNVWNFSLDVSITPNGEGWAKDGANIWCDSAHIGGSTLAWSYLADNTCNRPKQQRINSSRTWQFWFAVATMAHEIGHALGHHHVRTAGALMRPEINAQSIERKGWQSAADFAQSKQLGYAVKNTVRPSDDIMILVPGSNPLPRPEDPDDPTPGGTFFTGVITPHHNGMSLGDFILVPKPRV